jgi:hypothetical protein
MYLPRNTMKQLVRDVIPDQKRFKQDGKKKQRHVPVRGLSGKYPAIFSISRTGRVALL